MAKLAFARYGLLATTLAMGSALVANSVVSYFGVREASQSLLAVRSFDLAMALRRELHFTRSIDDETLATVALELRDQGVRYLAVIDDTSQAIIASSGTARLPHLAMPRTLGPRRRGPPHEDGPLQWQAQDGVVRVVAMLCGRGQRPHMGGGGPGCMLGRSATGIIEYEPTAANTMQSRAFNAFVLSVAAATLLALAALMSWRKTKEAERLTDLIARDRHLKLLGQMSATLSHELRNPLASLKGHAQLLREKLAPEHPARGGAERVILEAQRLEALADHVLELARLGTVTCRDENPRTVAQAAIEATGDNHVVLTVAPDVTTWCLDRPRMEQLLVNLLKNARQASPPGASIELTITLADNKLMLTVRDFGQGIAEGDEQRIFEPFYTSRVHGTGLGLAIAKQIAEAHRGSIEGATHPQGGALFRVTLPAKPRLSR